jgi:hypothetical protein
MYDINVFLENRREIVRAIDNLDFNFDGVGDYDTDTFECEIDMGNVSLVMNVTIKETFVAYSRETRWEPADYELKQEVNEINEAYYITSEGDEIPCTDNEIEAIKNVIKSLL